METPSLEYFIEIANSLNLSKSSENLHISQQALSAYIKKLEDHYHILLFHRKPHLALTEAGERLLEAANEVHHVYSLLESDLSEMHTTSEIKITIGIFSPMLDMAMKSMPLQDFGRKYPMISFRFISGFNSEIIDMLYRSKIDFGIAGILDLKPEYQELFKIRHLANDCEHLIVTDSTLRTFFADSYPECIQRFTKGCTLAEFAHVPIVLPPISSGISAKIYRYYKEHHLEVKLLGEGSDQTVTNTMVCQNPAFGLCRQHTPPPKLQDDIVYSFPMTDPYLHREDALIYRRDKKMPRCISEFMELLEMRWIDNLPVSGQLTTPGSHS